MQDGKLVADLRLDRRRRDLRGPGAISTYLGFLLAGLGGGAVVASLALGLVLSYRSSGVVNFAHAAMGMYVAYAFFEFRETGDLVLPDPRAARAGAPARPADPGQRPGRSRCVLGAVRRLVVYGLIFRPLRRAPVLARVVASLGLLLYLQEIVRLRFPVGRCRREQPSTGAARGPGPAWPAPRSARTACCWWRSSSWPPRC